MKDIKNLIKEELEREIINIGCKKFNAVQILNWIYKKRVSSFEIMSNLSKDLRTKLNDFFYIGRLKILQKQVSKNQDTVKFLFVCEDKEKIESVLIKQGNRYTICISTQVGCPFKCKICATGKIGFIRNLTTSEILSQILETEKEESIITDNIVFMGMGEPLANYENFKKAVRFITDKEAIGMSYSRLTVSTCGLVPSIERLINDNLKINLSISLHSVVDRVRNLLTPINRKYNIKELFKVCKKYNKHFKLPVTFEYVLIKDVNDSEKDCKELIELIREFKISCKVNLIPLNIVRIIEFKPSSKEVVRSWQERLETSNIVTTIRIEKGADIHSACGQLAGDRNFG
ncbi:MAG: 23S rRNA (adenine(2503)-C(2))-methyltransferase RlmN [Candidatus Firestonebacteria bacterium]